jgi:hypothetical protein
VLFRIDKAELKNKLLAVYRHGALWRLLKAETKPTPKPAKNLPATNIGICVAAVCRMTPNENMIEETIRDQRRPIRSAIIAAPRAPKKVPAERIETISEV